MTKGLKLKVREFWGLNPTFAEVTEEKLKGGLFAPHLPPILNRINQVKTSRARPYGKNYLITKKPNVLAVICFYQSELIKLNERLPSDF